MCRILPIVNKIAQLRSESMEKQKSDRSEPAWCGLTVRRRHGRRKVRVSARASVDACFSPASYSLPAQVSGMHLCEITPELQLEILQFCTPRDLASLSRVHTSLSDVAQHALYSHIYFFAHPPDFIPLEDWDSDRNPSKLNKDGSLFHMLSTSARRAAIVKKLHIHFSDGDYWRGATVTTAVNDIMVQVSDT